jgi:glycine cleavage system aminomethyltransferase T
MSFEFLAPDAAQRDERFAPILRSPVERDLRRAGARIQERDGWNVAADFGDPDGEVAACRETVGVAECSHLGKIEIQAPAETLKSIVAEASGGAVEITPTRAAAATGAWWCPVHPERLLVVASPSHAPELRDALERAAAGQTGATVVEVTTTYGAHAVIGPQARETLARLSALDMRPGALADQAFAPVSVARVPGLVLHEEGDRFLVLFGAAYGQYMWEALLDAAQHLGGRPVGADALGRLGAEALQAAEAARDA